MLEKMADLLVGDGFEHQEAGGKRTFFLMNPVEGLDLSLNTNKLRLMHLEDTWGMCRPRGMRIHFSKSLDFESNYPSSNPCSACYRYRT